MLIKCQVRNFSTVIFVRLFSFTIGVVDILYWKGLYDIIDCLPDEQFWYIMHCTVDLIYSIYLIFILLRWRPYFTLALGTVGLWFAGYSRSMVSAPNGTSLDIKGCSFEAGTIYQYDVSLKFALSFYH